MWRQSRWGGPEAHRLSDISDTSLLHWRPRTSLQRLLPSISLDSLFDKVKSFAELVFVSMLLPEEVTKALDELLEQASD